MVHQKDAKEEKPQKNVRKLSAYFALIQPSLQSQGEVELESQTVQCTVCTESFQCDYSRASSVLHDTCSTAASDHDAGDVFDRELDLEIVSESTTGAVSSVFSSSTPAITTKLSSAITSCTASDIAKDDGDSNGFPVDQYQTVID